MNQLKYIIRAVGLRTCLLAGAVFLIGNFVLYYFLLNPGDKHVKDARHKLEELTETYLQMQAIDYESLTTALQEQKRTLTKKHDLANMAALSEEDVPHFVSKMERAATLAGLKLSAKIEHPTKKRHKTKQGFTGVNINMNFSGTFVQTERFLQRLDGWQEPVYISQFRLSRADGPIDRLAGRMLVTLYAKK